MTAPVHEPAAGAPLVSVLMPAYNAASFVGAAIQSILGQSFGDFELIVVNDGSSDRTLEVVQAFADERIRVVSNPRNMGLAGVRNRLLDLARGSFAAWLDADDISHRKRLGEQLDLLKQYPSIICVGGFLRTLPNGDVWRYPTKPDDVRAEMLFANPLATSTVMMRMAPIRSAGLRFRDNFPPSEDYDFWERLSELGDVANLNRVLLEYRVHPDQASGSARGREAEARSVLRIQRRQLERLGVAASAADLEIHLLFGLRRFRPESHWRAAAEGWLRRLKVHFTASGAAGTPAYRKALLAAIDRYWFLVCYENWEFGPRMLVSYMSSPLAWSPLGCLRSIKFGLRLVKAITTGLAR